MQEYYYYKLLELKPGATPAEVKAAYRKLVKKYHPDLTGKGSSRKFNEIVFAYRQLLISPAFMGNLTWKFTGQAAPRGYQAKAKKTENAIKIYNEIARNGKILLSAHQAGLRRNAAIYLGRTGKKSAYAFLRRGLWDGDPEVVLAVVKAITVLKPCQAGAELGALFIKTTRPVKLAILDFAGIMAVYPGFEYILSLGLRDTDPVVRNYVLIEKSGRHQ